MVLITSTAYKQIRSIFLELLVNIKIARYKITRFVNPDYRDELVYRFEAAFELSFFSFFLLKAFFIFVIELSTIQYFKHM